MKRVREAIYAFETSTRGFELTKVSVHPGIGVYENVEDLVFGEACLMRSYRRVGRVRSGKIVFG